MAVDVLTEIIIHQTVDVVSAYAADPSNAPEWYDNIGSVEWRTEPPLDVGTRVAFVAKFLGRRLAYIYEVVGYVAGERLVMRTTQGPFPMETTYTWTAVDDDESITHMTLRNRGEPSGFSRFVSPLMGRLVQRANQKDLAKLKALLESR
jgi:hypothetical protein